MTTFNLRSAICGEKYRLTDGRIVEYRRMLYPSSGHVLFVKDDGGDIILPTDKYRGATKIADRPPDWSPWRNSDG